VPEGAPSEQWAGTRLCEVSAVVGCSARPVAAQRRGRERVRVEKLVVGGVAGGSETEADKEFVYNKMTVISSPSLGRKRRRSAGELEGRPNFQSTRGRPVTRPNKTKVREERKTSGADGVSCGR
jgi:hypothetical protein